MNGKGLSVWLVNNTGKKRETRGLSSSRAVSINPTELFRKIQDSDRRTKLWIG